MSMCHDFELHMFGRFFFLNFKWNICLECSRMLMSILLKTFNKLELSIQQTASHSSGNLKMEINGGFVYSFEQICVFIIVYSAPYCIWWMKCWQLCVVWITQHSTSIQNKANKYNQRTCSISTVYGTVSHHCPNIKNPLFSNSNWFKCLQLA